IGDIIQALMPDVQALAVDGIRGFLSDPDGSGPQDSPIADAIETTLAGITIGSNARFQVSVGTGPGQCVPPPGAPNFTASYAPPAAFPSFAATTPVGNVPYGLG